MVRRGLAGLGLAGILVIGLAPAAAADTFGSLTGDENTVDVQFSRWDGGVRQDWFVFAVRDNLAATTTFGVSYGSERAITCRDGSDGFISTFFDGSAPGSLWIGRSLVAAAGAVKVRGTQESFDSCADRSRSTSKAFAVSFAIGAASPLATDTLTQDILWEDGICYLLTQHFAGREAQGAAIVDGRLRPTSAASIGHSDWDSVPQSSTACE